MILLWLASPVMLSREIIDPKRRERWQREITDDISRSGWTGLLRKSSPPLLSASSRRLRLVSAVRKTIGIRVTSSFWRITPASSIPLQPGMLMSIRIRSGRKSDSGSMTFIGSVKTALTMPSRPSSEA